MMREDVTGTCGPQAPSRRFSAANMGSDLPPVPKPNLLERDLQSLEALRTHAGGWGRYYSKIFPTRTVCVLEGSLGS